MLACRGGAGSVNAATIIHDGHGIMTGGTGADVAGASYDVEFVEGSCNSFKDMSDDPAIVDVEWALSPVPLPAAAWLFMSAIAGLAGAKHLSRSRRPVEQIYSV